LRTMRPDFRRWIVLLCGAVMLTAGTACGPTAYKITPVPADQELREKVLVDEGGLMPTKIVLIDVDGILINRDKPTLFGQGEHPVSMFVEKLDKAAADPSVKAVILRINSPGGSVTASDLMYTEILRFKTLTKNQRPVMALLMDVAASGGYYVACACDEIIAQPTTVTGSIGVIMQMVNFSGTMARIGITADAVTSGPMKDAGSPFRPMKPEEREVFQKLVDQFYERFVVAVATGRKNLTVEQVREVADGRVYSASEAMDLGFVDGIGTLRDGLALLKKQLGARRVRVVTYHRPLDWKPNIYAEAPGGAPQVNLVNITLPEHWPHPTPQFMYLWAPGL